MVSSPVWICRELTSHMSMLGGGAWWEWCVQDMKMLLSGVNSWANEWALGRGSVFFKPTATWRGVVFSCCEHSIQRFVLARLEVLKFMDLGLPTLPEVGESKRQSLQITLAWQSVWVVQKGLWLKLPGANSQDRSGNTDSLAHPL